MRTDISTAFDEGHPPPSTDGSMTDGGTGRAVLLGGALLRAGFDASPFATLSVQAKLTAAAERVRAIATVHATLYQSDDVRMVALDEHLRAFCQELAEGGASTIRILLER